MNQIRVASVSYLNARPLVYGLTHHPVINQIQLTEDYPAFVARQLVAGEVDMGLIPVAMIPKLPQSFIVADYCIGADGPVASVCLFSEVPMDQITHVYLDYQSRTSVNLARVLLREYWKKDVQFLDATGEDFRDKIKGNTAGVVIGDRALEQRQCSPFIYDLAEAWIDHTGLPFVFAAWVANKPLPPDFVAAFNEANKWGLEQLEVVLQNINYPVYDLNKYFTQNISYLLDAEKRKGLALFLEKLRDNT
ncbi:menaquinone biosynthetic enzyme MqnA/MqnD family protein [Paracnuella aquatica]|uniref:menaquinone biosynthetic enzyme MqnA/MqnD family protein n=1 Tax=Paracnuella aquatica TaxID=2268757 RepID=UPI001F4D4CBC|nr:menaquinone biosynthesis protein [Paracnuella aquatica]